MKPVRRKLCLVPLFVVAALLFQVPAFGGSWDDSTLMHYFPALSLAAGVPTNIIVGNHPSAPMTFPYTYGVVNWPVTLRVKNTNGVLTFRNPPALPVVYSELMFQGILVEVSDQSSPSVASLGFVEVDTSQQSNVDLAWSTGVNKSVLFLVNLSKLPLGQASLNLRLVDQNSAVIGQLPLTVTTTQPAYLDVNVNDAADGTPTTARVGVLGNGLFAYPESDPSLPATTTIPLYDDFKGTVDEQKRFYGDSRWPIYVYRAFYTRGQFSLAVVPGTINLVVAKGYEYGRYQETFTLAAGQTAYRSINLARQYDMPAEGWYSIDDHVHIPRDGTTDADILDWCKAEDVHYANAVQMGDVKGLTFLQSAFGPASDYSQGNYLLHAAQEDPRTDERGHALTFGNGATYWDPQRYYLYEDVFDQTHADGGVVGYAHGGSYFYAGRGLAIDIPLGKSDFIEMLVNIATSQPDTFYEWWNLGYKTTVTSGSDFPFGDFLVGRSRFYVNVDPALPFTHANVMNAIAAGKTYATNGPIVDFTVNGVGPGSQLDLTGPQTLNVKVHARLNPTLGDQLVKIELISQGNVIAEQLVVAGGEYDTTMTANISTADSRWIAAQVTGGVSVAHTTPVYVVIDAKRFWRADELYIRVPQMDQFLVEMETEIAKGTVPASQAAELQSYIDQARAILLGMLVCPTLTLSPLPTPKAVLGVPLNESLTSPNGYNPLLTYVTTGNLPTGVQLATDGTLSGTPTALGQFNFSVQVTDVIGCVGAQSFTISVVQVDGAPCAAGAECLSGFCADGVCCNSACAGPCGACSVASGSSNDGTCSWLDGMSCDDGSLCTLNDTCQLGVCTGQSPVVCVALDECHAPGSCDPVNGVCSNPPMPDGAPCGGGACLAGACAASGTGAGSNGAGGNATSSAAGTGGNGGASTTGAASSGGSAPTSTSGAGGSAGPSANEDGGCSVRQAGDDSDTSSQGAIVVLTVAGLWAARRRRGALPTRTSPQQ